MVWKIEETSWRKQSYLIYSILFEMYAKAGIFYLMSMCSQARLMWQFFINHNSLQFSFTLNEYLGRVCRKIFLPKLVSVPCLPCNEHQRQSSGIDSRLDTQRANGCFSSNGLQIFMEKQWLLVCIAALSKGHSLCSLYSNGLCFCNTVDWILCAKILAKRFFAEFFCPLFETRWEAEEEAVFEVIVVA